MFKKILISSAIFATSLSAHTAIMTCFDNGDSTITCEGGFSDGASGSGVSMYITQNEKKIIKGVMDENSEFTFKKPKGAYEVYFNAGKSHVVVIKGKDILE